MIRHALRLAAFLLACLLSAPAGAAEGDAAAAQTAWRLLDYVAVDYPGAVQKGAVISAPEFAEMSEFAEQARARIAALPAKPEQAVLLTDAEALKTAIAGKAEPDEVARRAHALADALLAAYPVPMAPASPPDLARGAALYQDHCASCHGATGHADGPAAAGLDPPPIAFADPVRARERSLFGLYQVIGQGLDGTAMTSFDFLPQADRWALAFYAGHFAYGEADVAAGKTLWETDAALRSAVPNLEVLTHATEAGLAAGLGTDKAHALTAYLRAHPEAAKPEASGTLALMRTRLAETRAAYEAGDARKAGDLALSAYLDGFEPVEAVLTTRDQPLMRKVESAMLSLRAAIAAKAPAAEIAQRIDAIGPLIDGAERTLAPSEASAVDGFLGAFTILLREGLEALLIVVAMIAFLAKAERRDALAYVHGGWVAALVAGLLTWVVATRVIAISGAGRELTEGLGGVIAAVVLVSVGIWMHGKSHADGWLLYIREKMSVALSRGSAWFLFGLAFIVVYREAFETILFFIALWAGGSHGAILAGAGAAALVLAAIGWAMLRYSQKLPIGQFFFYSSILMAVLAVVLAGKGVAALQEAGWAPVHPVAGAPRIELLGVYPSLEPLLAQALTLAVLLVAFRWNNKAALAQKGA